MTFLPIVERELRVASRRSATYWSRAQIALAALVPTIFLLIGPTGFTTASQRGSEIFQTLSFLAFFFAIFSAVRLTADCISSEKREGTLGLLFLTDLKPYDVVLGKLSATSLTSLYGMVALLPVLAIPVLLGGVTLGDLGRLTVVLLNTLFFALSVAMFVSVVSWQERKAIGLATTLLLGFCIGLPIAGGIVASTAGRGELAPWFAQASPGYACGMIRSASYGGAPGAFWFSTAVTHGLGWLFFGLSCRMLPRAWQDRPSDGLWKRWRDWCKELVMGDPASRAVFRRWTLNLNPVFWLASRERRMVWYPWILLGALAMIAGFTCIELRVRGVEFSALLLSTFFLHWFFKHWIINIACQAFAADRDKGALELLLSTPLRIDEVLAGYGRALRRQFLMPVVTMLTIEIVLYIAGAISAGSDSDRLAYGSVLAFGAIVLVADCVAAAWVSWWASVVSRNASSAVTSVYVRLMIGPWFAVGAVMMTAYVFAADLLDKFAGVIPVASWFVVSLVADFFLGKHARRNLLTQLRTAAVERYGGGDAGMIWWRQLGRALGRKWGGRKQESRSAGAV